MKKTPGLLLILALLSIGGFAQQEPTDRPVPGWVSEKGYWEVVNNINTPENFTIYFFNNEGTMVYKEQVEGVRLDMKKKKTLLRLRRVLDKSVIAWENHQVFNEKEMLVAVALKGDKWPR